MEGTFRISLAENGEWRLRREDEIDPTFKLGLVQTPQSFYNPDLFQFNLYAEQGIPNEQDFVSREVNILRNASNAVAYTGSNTVISRQGTVHIGGFPLNTITEDFETSIRLQQGGYITYATQEVQAAGHTTTTIPSMIKQRIRWARGIIKSLQNTRAPLSRKLPFWTRVTRSWCSS
ncbi:glycosyltransferase family 2 protein [Paenibacillus macerans]|uniref:glycosyltransferase family 2 protein n=1 Tax=Paenibacillus macerans TaxID=44252 RepID=UPI00203D1451|nr:glycosyltransferase family 2 protein [Paenibacillus macerans]MCM3698552.1 glycosyltransferase [Paenibacillus macerans]